eukprot:9722313-Alexandrium_andersonii.AAC.1
MAYAPAAVSDDNMAAAEPEWPRCSAVDDDVVVSIACGARGGSVVPWGWNHALPPRRREGVV